MGHLACLEFGFLVVSAVVYLNAESVHADTLGRYTILLDLCMDIVVLYGADNAVHCYILLCMSKGCSKGGKEEYDE